MLAQIIAKILEIGFVTAVASAVVVALILYKSWILLCILNWFFPEYSQTVTVWHIFGLLSLVGLAKGKLEDAKKEENVDVKERAITLGRYLFFLTLLWGINYAVRFWLM